MAAFGGGNGAGPKVGSLLAVLLELEKGMGKRFVVVFVVFCLWGDEDCC